MEWDERPIRGFDPDSERTQLEELPPRLRCYDFKLGAAAGTEPGGGTKLAGEVEDYGDLGVVAERAGDARPGRWGAGQVAGVAVLSLGRRLAFPRGCG